MAKEFEIEKKYKVKRLPGKLNDYEHITIEQAYLNKEGSPIRLRKFIKENGIRCLFSKKAIIRDHECIEYNVELPEKIFEELLEAKEGIIIKKTRFYIPLDDGLKVDLDVFHGFYEGVCVAEIEFKSIEQANNYKLPDWLDGEVKDFIKLTNSYMATHVKDISEYQEFMIIKE